MRPTVSELSEAAALIDGLVPGGEPALALAFAWLARNRAEAARGNGAEFGDGSLASALAGFVAQGTVRERERKAAATLGPAFTSLVLALSGCADDPTNGALYVQDHRSQPRRARGLRATALIGPYLFLARSRP